MKRDYFFNNYWYKPVKDKTLNKRKERLLRRTNKNKYQDALSLKLATNSLFRCELKYKATKAEIIFGDWLWKNKVFFKFQKGFLKPFHRIVDFYLPDLNTIVEIDGGYHKKIIWKDQNKDKIWSKFKTVRIKNEEIFDSSFKEKYKYLISTCG